MSIDTGGLDVNLPYQIKLEKTGDSGSGARTVSLNPSFVIGNTGSFSSQFPKVTVDSDFVFDLAASAIVDACIFDCFLSNQQIIPSPLRDIESSLDFFNYDTESNQIKVFDQAIGSAVAVSIPLSPGMSLGIKYDASVTPKNNETGNVQQITTSIAAGATNSEGEKIPGLSAGFDLGSVRFAGTQGLDADVAGSGAKSFLGGGNLNTPVDLVTLDLDIDGLASLQFATPPGGVTLNAGPASLFMGRLMKAA